MNSRKLIFLAILLLLIALFFVFDLGSYLSFENIKASRDEIVAWREAQPLLAVLIAFLVYVAVTALSLPGATIMTLAIAAVFGFFWGLVLVSFASTIGATLAFLISRFIFRDVVQASTGWVGHYGGRGRTGSRGEFQFGDTTDEVPSLIGQPRALLPRCIFV